MKCERCGKETWTSLTIYLTTVNGAELYKVCPKCKRLWVDTLVETLVKFMKEGELK